MKKTVLFIFACTQLITAVSCSSNSEEEQASVVPKDSNKWELVWSEEFGQPGLINTQNWNYHEGDIYNNELQTYPQGNAENVRIENGTLIIEAHKKGNNQYTSGSINTKGKHSMLYGKIEVAAKLPEGRGIWPAIWMLSDDDSYGWWPKSGEIDIMEFVGFQPNTIHTTVHTQDFNHTHNNEPKKQTYVENLQSQFNRYGIEWTPTEIRFLINDQEVNRFENKNTGSSNNTDLWPFNKPFHLILNVAVGGAWGGAQGVDDNIFPQRMEVQYVHFYKMKGQ